MSCSENTDSTDCDWDFPITQENEITRLRAENEALRKALGEAIEWNWLDDDRPEHLFKMYLAMAREEG